MKSRVNWTDKECRLLADTLIKKGIESVEHPEFLDAIRTTQSEVLTEDRHRAVRNRMSLRCLEPFFDVPAETPLKDVSDTTSPPEDAVLQDVQGGSVDELIETLANMAALKFADHFKNALKRIVEDGSHDFVQNVIGTKAKKKRVTVVGLLPQQAAMINLEYGSRLDCRFLGSDTNVNELRSAVANSDFIVGMVGFMSHPTDAILAKSESYMRISGGMSKLRSILDKLV